VFKTIVVIGFVQSLFGMLIFLTKRPKHLSFTFLAVWLAVIAIFLGAGLLPFQVVNYFKPGIFPVLFLLGPLLYLYVSSLAVEDFRFRPIMFVHLAPLLLVSVHRSLSDAVPISSSLGYNNVYYSLLIVSLTFYWFLSLTLILKHRKSIPYHFSNYTPKNSLTWLIFVLSAFLVLFLAHFMHSFLRRVLGAEVLKFPVFPVNLTLFTFIMIFFGINQSAIYNKEKLKSDSPDEPDSSDEQQPKYIRPALNELQIGEMNQTVVHFLKMKKPFLNPEYNLQMMADDLNLSRHKLSQVINHSQKKNFYKFINAFRVEEVKEKLADPAYEHFTVLGIGLECGFNSKTSFNRIFKEETGLTPTEYKRNL